MSRSNNTDLVNPAVRFFDWKGGEGILEYYDKEKEERVTVPLPFKFLVLDRVAQVGGGTGRGNDYQGFWSNAVRDTRKEPFIVRTKQGIYAEGLWKDIKDKNTSFVTGLYIAFHDEDKNLQIGYLKLKGAANSSWIDFTNKHQRDIYKGVFAITDKELDDSGPVKFYRPVFVWSDKITDETNDMALSLDEQILQPYLMAYFARTVETNGEVHYTGESYEPEAAMADAANAMPAGTVEDDDDIPF